MQLPEEFSQSKFETDQMSTVGQSGRHIKPITVQGTSSSGSSGKQSGINISSMLSLFIIQYITGSGPITFRGISLTIWTRFKQLFDQIKEEKGFNLEEMCLHVAMEIRELGGKIKKNTVQRFYERNIKKKDDYIST
jgi:hypothetical protein